MSNKTIYEFSFNEQLPRVYEVVNCIISVAPGAGYFRPNRPLSENVKDAIHGCSVKLKNLWERAFGSRSIKSLSAIKKQIRNYLKQFLCWIEPNKVLFKILNAHGYISIMA